MFTVAVIIIYFPYGAEETTKQYFITLSLNVHSFNLANIWNINSDNLVWQLKQNESFKSPFVLRPNYVLNDPMMYKLFRLTQPNAINLHNTTG